MYGKKKYKKNSKIRKKIQKKKRLVMFYVLFI